MKSIALLISAVLFLAQLSAQQSGVKVASSQVYLGKAHWELNGEYELGSGRYLHVRGFLRSPKNTILPYAFEAESVIVTPNYFEIQGDYILRFNGKDMKSIPGENGSVRVTENRLLIKGRSSLESKQSTLH